MDDKEWGEMLRHLRDVDDMDRYLAAAHKLTKLKDRSRLPQLYSLLQRCKWFNLREIVGIAICRMDGLKALPDLLKGMDKDGHDYDGLMTELTGVVSRQHRAAAPMILKMAKSKKPREQSRAAWLMGYAAKSLKVEPLLELLQSKHAEVRRSAAATLPSFPKCPDLFEKYAALAHDPDDIVRRIAIMNLGETGDKRAKAIIQKAANDPSAMVTSIVKYSLQQLREARQSAARKPSASK